MAMTACKDPRSRSWNQAGEGKRRGLRHKGYTEPNVKGKKMSQETSSGGKNPANGVKTI